MNPKNDDSQDQEVHDLLASLSRDVPAADAGLRRRLAEQSLREFNLARQVGQPGQPGSVSTSSTSRRFRMTRTIWRSAAGLAAAAMLLSVWLVWPLVSAHAAPTLGEVLSATGQSQSLHMQIVREAGVGEGWYARATPQPGQPVQAALRANNPDGTYLIARGDSSTSINRAWLIDEKANRAASQKAAYITGYEAELSFLALLNLADARDAFLATKPVAEKRGGRDVLVYRCDCVCIERIIHIEAVADPATKLLQSLETTVTRGGKTVPVARLTVLGVNEPVREELFVVGDSLTEDGRIGKVTDAQGIVLIKPVMAARWTPVSDGMIIKPGDWLQTDIRGANAATVRLAGGPEIVVGPGSTVELVSPKQLRISEGEVRVVAPAKSPVELLAAGEQKAKVVDRGVYRVHDDKLVKLDAAPIWLKSFEGKIVNESLGSLVAKVDGRNVPLTVGYHKVAVDIRDQIARTVVEESFVNTTPGRLEGQFYFPLPQDASISGFGMWIGDQLVEADIVEKQRAREIYEEILREKRDPGLLEWSGGNLFKARVFPIEAHSEKRIKISYTQVLAMKGDAYRYSYALQSEMLKLHPLRELQIDVRLNSAAAIKAVSCPTHTARLDQTAHSAHVEFTAQEYTPNRDLEVVVQVEGSQSDVTLIPHRRGDNGYFMLMISPQITQIPQMNHLTEVRGDILPDAAASQPDDVLILADTSASMDAGQRAAQAEFIATLLGSLSPNSTFNLACCDVECNWVFDKSMPVSSPSPKGGGEGRGDFRTLARDFLANRISLGWTDLDKAFASAIAHCGPKTRVVYVGDGIPTTGDGDAVAFAKRLRQLYLAKGEWAATFYAVSTGSTYESGVLKAIASLGGGSVRQIGGERTPRVVALELLDEMSHPPLSDLKIEFRGLRTARVYPDELPNLPAGSQQIVLGRYLPQGEDQNGEVIVTGTRNGKPVRYSATVSLKDAGKTGVGDDGNSFIPRLWARMHLDALLAQGTSSEIRDEIIALSEEFHIMTPYTSLLVLESDADRERFAVTRRFQMRDGEKFFADGRDNANYELTQQQMKRAGNWRLGLRSAVLRQFSGLGRNGQLFARGGQLFQFGPYEDKERNEGSLYLGDSSHGSFGSIGGSGGGQGWNYEEERVGIANGRKNFGLGLESEQSGIDAGWSESPASLRSLKEEDRKLFNDEIDGDKAPSDPARSDMLRASPDSPTEAETPSLSPIASTPSPVSGPARPLGGLEAGEPLEQFYSTATAARRSSSSSGFGLDAAFKSNRYRGYRSPAQYIDDGWFGALFPTIPAAGKEPPAVKAKKPWPAEAQAISNSLLRKSALAQLKGGLAVERLAESFNVDSGESASQGRSVWLISPKAWSFRSENDYQQTYVQCCDGKVRAIFSKGFLLGRSRAAVAEDLALPPIDFAGESFAFSSLERAYQGYKVEVKNPPEGLDLPFAGGKLLVLTHSGDAVPSETRILVDTTRRVIYSIEHFYDGNLTSSQRFKDFVEVAGAWWAGRVESFDDKGRRTSVVTEKFAAVTVDEFNTQLAKELADRARVQFLAEPGRSLTQAKAAVALGKADFDDQAAMMLHFARSGQWARAMEHLDALEKLADGPKKAGMRWVRSAFLNVSRKHEELKKRFMDDGATLAQPATTQREDLPLAEYVLGQASNLFEPNERLALLDAIRPVYERQPARLLAVKRWQQNRLGGLEQVGRSDEALALAKQLASDYPRDGSMQIQYATRLVNAGLMEEAYSWLERALNDKQHLSPQDDENIRNQYADMLGNQGRYDDALAWVKQWVDRKPESTNAYSRYLAALIRVDRTDDASKLVVQWITDSRHDASKLAGGPAADRLSPVESARLQAGVAQALGEGYRMYSNQVDERWFKLLTEAAIHFACHPTESHIAQWIMNDYRFQRTDACRAVRKVAVARLQAEIDTLKPPELERLTGWILPNDPAVEPGVWKQLAAGLHKRWLGTEDADACHRLGSVLGTFFGRVGADDYLAFLREQFKTGPEDYRARYAAQLFDAVTTRPWTPQFEDEAFTLIDQLVERSEPASGATGGLSASVPAPGPTALADKPPVAQILVAEAARLVTTISALHTLDDRMVAGRFNMLMYATTNPEELTRTELIARRTENLRKARVEFADRLAKESAKRQADKHPASGLDVNSKLLGWINAERIYLNILADRDLTKAAAEVREILGPAPQKVDLEAHPERWPDEALRNRMLVTLANLACRRKADPALIDTVMKYVDAGIAMDREDPRWRLMKYELLVALDRPKDLETVLNGWARGGDADNRWKISLGYLLAEQAKLVEAVRLFEAVAAVDELGANEYRTLADWYMAINLTGSREKYQQAMLSAYKTTPDYQLRNQLYYDLMPWQDAAGKPPAELDGQVLLMFAALFEKSSDPANDLNLLRQYYAATHDFRLLACLADGMVGHTAGQVYPFLRQMNYVLSEIRDEATADSIVAYLPKVRERAKTDVDQRALDLLEMQVERRAAELLNQPGPHGDKAVAALKRAFARTWSAGEPRLMVELLAGLGNIAYKPLADEQVREMETLHREAAKGSADRLDMADKLAGVYWRINRQQPAIDLLADAIGEFEAANGGKLPESARSVFADWISFLQQRRHYDRGETILFDHIKRAAYPGQRTWLSQMLYALYGEAMAHGGAVSLGSGETLYKAAEQKVLAALTTADQDYRSSLISQLCTYYRVAHEKNLKFPTVLDDLHNLAFKTVPEVLVRQTNQYGSIVETVTSTLKDLAGPRDALAFLIERIEHEPGWFRWNNQDGWSQHGYRLAELRTKVPALGDLEDRLLKIVLAELRRDLGSGVARDRWIYDCRNGNNFFWKERTADFRKAAEEVYTQHKNSGATVVYIANYLYHSLKDYNRAIEILFIAHDAGLLDEAARWQLVGYLHWQNRWGESIALLQGLLELKAPAYSIEYRMALMRAFFHTNRKAELETLRAQTDALFHKNGGWGENVLALLAATCLECQLYELSVTYYKELIPLHQRTAPNRGIGNGILSSYYDGQARAHAGLGQTLDAVDAACGAIVSWGPTNQNRAEAIKALRIVMNQAPKLDEFVVELDRQVAQSGLENPIVRKALGQVYMDKGEFDKAITQLKLACQIQPNDVETHQALVSCFDRKNDKAGAISQLLQSLQLVRRDIALYRDLGQRYEASNQSDQAERANTSIVEALSSEAESHEALAGIRQQQDRWPEAVVQWQQVARIRALEPTGLLGLGGAQTHLKQWDALADTLAKLSAKTWPARFSDAPKRIDQLRQQLEQGRAKEQK